MTDANSGDLFRRSTQGDAAAMQALLQRHLPALRAFARLRMTPLLRAHESASDLVQSACRELCAMGGAFDFRGEAPFRAWLYTTVWNKLRNHDRDLRAQQRDARRNVSMEDGSSGEQLAACYSQALSPSRVAMCAESVRQLETAFDELPEHYREVITLSRIAQLDRAQVAAAMGRTEASVRNLLHRALAVLAETLRRRGVSA